MEGVSEKQHAHELIERLRDSDVLMAVRFLEFMLLDPVTRALRTAPPDEELVTEDDRKRIVDGRAYRQDRDTATVPMEEVMADLGFKPNDFPPRNRHAR